MEILHRVEAEGAQLLGRAGRTGRVVVGVELVGDDGVEALHEGDALAGRLEVLAVAEGVGDDLLVELVAALA